MANIGKPVEVIEVRPRELPLPQTAPPMPAPVPTPETVPA